MLDGMILSPLVAAVEGAGLNSRPRRSSHLSGDAHRTFPSHMRRPRPGIGEDARRSRWSLRILRGRPIESKRPDQGSHS